MEIQPSSNELVQELEDSISSAIGCALTLMEKIKFDNENGQHLSIVCLFARIVELAASSKALLEKNALTGIPFLFRGMFEADIDLTNSMNDPNYFKTMYATFLKERIRLSKEVVPEKDNPYLNSLIEFRDYNEETKRTQQELSDFKKKGYRPIMIRDKADKAGKLNEYVSVYNLLCLDTHNNLVSLEKYHINKNKDKKEHEVFVFHINKEDQIAYISGIPGIIFHRSRDIIDFFEIKEFNIDRPFKEFEQLQNKLEKFSREELIYLKNKIYQKETG
jgi:hypothetical protein